MRPMLSLVLSFVLCLAAVVAADRASAQALPAAIPREAKTSMDPGDARAGDDEAPATSAEERGHESRGHGSHESRGGDSARESRGEDSGRESRGEDRARELRGEDLARESHEEEEPARPRSLRVPSRRYVTLTALPIRLLVPMYEAAAEVRLADEVAAAVFGGFGSAPVVVPGGASERRSAVEIGAQFRYYASGGFEWGGIHVGAELVYVRVSDEATQLTTSTVVPGLAIGPFVGFKLVLRGGFTLDSQIGVGYLAAKTSGAARYDPDVRAVLLGNLGVGWTF